MRFMQTPLSSLPVLQLQFMGLLLRNLIQVTILAKPQYVIDIYIPMTVTSFRFLNSNPGNGTTVWGLGKVRGLDYQGLGVQGLESNVAVLAGWTFEGFRTK